MSQVLLDRHASRRAAGVPTVSVLIGPIAATSRLWRRWAGSSGLPTLSLHAPKDAFFQWTAELARHTDLCAAAVAALADKLGRNRDEFQCEWRAKTLADAGRFWEARVPLLSSSPLRRLAELAIAEANPSPAEIMQVLVPSPGADAFPMLRELAALAPTAPSLLFTPKSAANAVAWLGVVSGMLAEWAIQLPRIAIAATVPSIAWTNYCNQALDSRASALLREGVIEVPVLSEEAIGERLTGAGLGPDANATTRTLVAAGATAELLQSAAEAVQANVPPPTTPQEDDRARSAAERFLFEYLESIPETAGLFELNGTLDFRFGPRHAELDLLARAPRLAVEIDGYFHFRELDSYRRDRSKDYELQLRGYFVLRFLADDVVRRLELVRDRILEVLSNPPSRGTS